MVAYDDAARDVAHAVEIGFKDLPEGVSAGSPSKAVVHLDDDRGVPEFEINFSRSSITIREGGATLRPHVYLDEKTEVDLTIPLRSSTAAARRARTTRTCPRT